MKTKLSLFSVLLGLSTSVGGGEFSRWNALPELPAALGVAGPFAGVHNDVLLVAGGANFPEPVWENDKVWHRRIYALPLAGDRKWRVVGALARPVGYGASVSVAEGVVCMGGNDAERVFDDVFLLKSDGSIKALPSLPAPACNGAAATIGREVYFFPGMRTGELASASQDFLRLNLDNPDAGWESLASLPAPGRALSVLIAQNNGKGDRLYLIGGRLEEDSGAITFLADVFEFDPSQGNASWTKMASMPGPLAAGTGVAVGEHHIFMIAGADGSLMAKADDLKLDHPGFPKSIYSYDTTKNKWIDAGESPVNQVTTTAVTWNDLTFLVTGEVKPRVRTKQGWEISLNPAGALKGE
ncbi:kelch repeat-containing protein [Verrucomicrobiales bacterium BCK34]|nr:kelch repeat-containing protein [Verrucomicrobiales bacterium BCK34]